jgi:CheY-like chemotaxis protein
LTLSLGILRALSGAMPARPRVLVASPFRIECEMLAEWLSSDGLEPVTVKALPAAIIQTRSRPFDVLIADSTFAFEGGLQTSWRTRNTQAPVLVLGAPDRGMEAFAERSGAMYVTRPIDRTMLVCNIAMMLVDERPLRRSPRKPVARFDVVVEGVPSYLIDVSNEGMRLEIPRWRRVPPPVFIVKVPLIGTTLLVQRVWLNTASDPAASECAWCGGALGRNAAHSQRNWREFVDVLPGAA